MDAFTRTDSQGIPLAARAAAIQPPANGATVEAGADARALREPTHVPNAAGWAAQQAPRATRFVHLDVQTAIAQMRGRAADVVRDLVVASAGLGLLGVAYAAPPARVDATATTTVSGPVGQPMLLALEYSRERPAVLRDVIEETWLRRGFNPKAQAPQSDPVIEHLVSAQRTLAAQDPKRAWQAVLNARDVMKAAPTEGQVRTTLRGIQVSSGHTISQLGLGGQVDQATALAGSDVGAAARLTDEIGAAVGKAAYAHALQQSRAVALPKGRELPFEVTRLGFGAAAAYAHGDYVLTEAILRERASANSEALSALIDEPPERPSPTAMALTVLAFIGVGGAYARRRGRGD